MKKHRARFLGAGICGIVLHAILVPPPAAARDCNRNGSEDRLDIEAGSSRDCDSNGVPDECDLGPDNLIFSDAVELTLEGPIFGPQVVLLEDLTRDGLPDLVLFEAGNLLLLRGNRRGTFEPPTRVAIGPHQGIDVVATDTNGDGLRDLVAVVRPPAPGQAGLVFLGGKEDGSFAEPLFEFHPGDAPNALAAADLDGDGAVDVATVGLYATTVWWNDGAGDLAPGAQFVLDSTSISLTAGDLDRDGNVDLVVVHNVSEQVSILWSRGGRQFTDPQKIPMGDMARSAILLDVDGDGDSDLASSSDGRDTVSLVLNEGHRGFSAPVTHGMGGLTRRVLPGDADGDGSVDLVALRFTTDCNRTRASLSVLLNRGDGSFLKRRDRDVPLDPPSLALGDIDGDGLLDAVLPRVAPGETPRVVVSTFLGMRGRWASDEDADGVPDECALEGRDCNWNGADDGRDIALGTSGDCDADGVPDECQPDCDGNGTPDACDIARGAADANSNGLLDACESADTADCNANGRLDSLDLATGGSKDCNGNRVPDECEVAPVFRFLSGETLRIGVGAPAAGVAAADLDRDGDVDLAVTTRADCCLPEARSGSLAILENLGVGKLALAGSHAADGDAVLVAAIDADGDVDPDLLVVNHEISCRGPPRASLLLNDGRGGFRRAEGFALASAPAGAATGDLDRDGDIDLAFANADSFAAAVSIFLNDGTGRFELSSSAGPRGQATAITAGDWNGDGLLDLAAAAGTLRVLVNAGGGAFTASTPPDGLDKTFSVATADLDRDGDLDLLAGRLGVQFSSASQILLCRNDAGVFSIQGTRDIGTQPEWLLARDWNGDGAADLIAGGIAASSITNGVPGGISTLLNQGDGTLEPAWFFTADSRPPAGEAGDVNGDDALDLVMTDEAGAAVVVLNEGRGRLAAPLQYSVGSAARAIIALDANGDGDQDLAVLHQDDPPAGSLLANEGKGMGFSVSRFRDGLPRGARAMAAGDLDGDGDTDVAAAGEFTIGIVRNEGGALKRGLSLPVGSNPFSIVASDLDRDGKVDLATSNILGSGFRDNVTVFRNEGSGTFAAGRNFAVGMAPVSLIATDLDGDAFDELISANASSADLTVLWNLAGGSFAAGTEISTGPSAFHLRHGDTDGDGDPDLLFSNLDQIQIATNLASQAFLRGRPAVSGFHFTFEPPDLDGDADPDIVLATHGQIHVFGSSGDGLFLGPAISELSGLIHLPLPPPAGQGGSGDPFGASSIAPADLDDDGDVDLALALIVFARVIILENATRRAVPDVNHNSIPDACEEPSATVFRRGDAREDGSVDMTDAVVVLRHLFVTGDPLSCRKAADANDDARVDVSDAVAILRFLFLGHDAPPGPFPGCGPDPTPDLVECAGYASCP